MGLVPSNFAVGVYPPTCKSPLPRTSMHASDARFLRIWGLRVDLTDVRAQEALIGQLQRKLSELSRNASPAVGPVNPGDGAGGVLDMESLGLGLAALNVPGPVPSD